MQRHRWWMQFVSMEPLPRTNSDHACRGVWRDESCRIETRGISLKHAIDFRARNHGLHEPPLDCAQRLEVFSSLGSG